MATLATWRSQVHQSSCLEPCRSKQCRWSVQCTSSMLDDGFVPAAHTAHPFPRLTSCQPAEAQSIAIVSHRQCSHRCVIGRLPFRWKVRLSKERGSSSQSTPQYLGSPRRAPPRSPQVRALADGEVDGERCAEVGNSSGGSELTFGGAENVADNSEHDAVGGLEVMMRTATMAISRCAVSS